MKDLIQVPFLKLFHYRTFWIIFLAIVATQLGVTWMTSSVAGLKLSGSNIAFQNFFYYPYVWQNISWIVHFGNYFLGLLIILLVCHDDEHRLMKQHIIDGWSREQVIASYLFLCLIMAIFTLVFNVSLGLAFGIKGDESFLGQEQIKQLSCFFMQSFIQLEFALLVSILVRKAVPAVMIFVSWQIIIEPIIGWLVDKYVLLGISDVLPFHVLGDLLTEPYAPDIPGLGVGSVHMNIILLSALYGLIFPALSWLRLKFSDI